MNYQLFGGAARFGDIDVFDFYAKHGPLMPIAEPIIREMLSQPAASYAPEKVFSGGKFVLNDHRTNLKPSRAEQLVISATRFKMKLSSRFLPKLPQDGIEDSVDDILERTRYSFGSGCRTVRT